MIKFDDYKTWTIKDEISIFKSYLEELKTFLNKENAKNIEKWRNLSEEEQDTYAEDFIEYEDKISKQNHILYSSFLIAIFSFFENELNEICNNFSIKNKSDILLKDFTGKGIHRAKLYMKKVCKMTLPKEELWEELAILGDIRNCLAHSGGVVKNNPRLIEYAKISKKMETKENKVLKITNLEITQEYCSFALGVIKEYLLFLCKK